MEQYLSGVTFVSLVAALAAVLALFVRQRQISARLRRQNAALRDVGRLRDEELRHLVMTRLPALVESLYGRPIEVPGPRDARFAGTAEEWDFQSVMQMFIESVDRAKTRADNAAKATLKSMMRAVQSLTNEQQLAISTMQERHDDPDVLEGLLRIDHMNAQIGRRAQATAVLCGSWPGQQRSASSLIDVVRGATSRIRDYLRVQVNPQVNATVLSRAVEPVVLAVAELLDNAARHSQPNTTVEVNFRSAHNGIAIVIDDAGVAMDAEELQRASRLLSGQETVDINRLGDPPQVGFAVVGVLAARYGFSVSVDTRSPYGGVRAVVFLPTEVLTRTENKPPVSAAEVSGAIAPGTSAMPTTPAIRATAAPSLPPALSLPSTPAAGSAEASRETTPARRAPASAEAPREREVTANGLPKRRRVTATRRDGPDDRSSLPGQALVTGESRPAARPAQTDLPPGRSARDVAVGMGAWQRGTRSGRATVPPAGPDSEGERSE